MDEPSAMLSGRASRILVLHDFSNRHGKAVDSTSTL
jgi:hypothetical protein